MKEFILNIKKLIQKKKNGRRRLNGKIKKNFSIITEIIHMKKKIF